MNKIILLFLAGTLIFVLAINSCTRDKTQPPAPGNYNCDTLPIISYGFHIKNIMDNNCAFSGCHLGANTSGVYLDTYSETRKTFEQGKGYCSVNQDIDCKPMPSGGPKLSDSLLNILYCWKERGYQQ